MEAYTGRPKIKQEKIVLLLDLCLQRKGRGIEWELWQQELVAEQKHECMKLIFCRKNIFSIMIMVFSQYYLPIILHVRIANYEGGITKLNQQQIPMMLFQLWLVPHPFEGACIHGRYPASSMASSVHLNLLDFSQEAQRV